MIAIAEALEGGALDARWARFLSGAWERTLGRTVSRRLDWPSGIRLVAVGGATLGGSGKTPLAIACAGELAAAGARTALVGHAYRASPRRARVVTAADSLEQVGDEALVAVRALAGSRVPVVVAPTRLEALALAARFADVVVMDGMAQAAPRRVSLALLAVDGSEPWGRAAALPPRGDLRASLETLLEACDAVVPLVDDLRDDPGVAATRAGGPGRTERPVWPARVASRGAWLDSGALLTWEALRRVRVGLLTALARPGRVTRALARRGVRPHVVLRGRDHGPMAIHRGYSTRRPRMEYDDVELWLATPKCVLHARRAHLAAPIGTLDHSVVLSPRLCARLRTLALP